MRALVLGGGGAVCKETTRDLARYSDFEEIVVADKNVEAALMLVDEIADSRLRVIAFDADQEAAMRRLFPAFDVVVNGLPFRYDYAVNRMCVEMGVNGLDLSSEDAQFALHDVAVEKEMLFVPGVGATPGITNMMVRRAAEVLDRLDTVDVAFAAFRCLAPGAGLLRTTLWEFDPQEEEREEVVFEEGTWHPAAPLSGERRVAFSDPIGEQPVYLVPHDEVYSLPRSFPTLRRVTVRGCFPPHVMELMGALMRGGLLSRDTVELGADRMAVRDVVERLLASSPASRQNPLWAYGLVVEVTGERDGRRVTCTYRSRHPLQEEWDGEAGYFKNVGIPLSIGAQCIAGDRVEGRGVLPPEQAFPPQLFFAELARRGIEVEERVAEKGTL
jgi:saccharopine dehydrogenase-like NADP-dependent oxidoreductase